MKTYSLLIRSFLLISCIAFLQKTNANNAPQGDCPVPDGLVVLAVNGATATLGWNAVPGATQYAIHVENTNNNPVLFSIEQTVTGAVQYTVTGLQPNSWYKFKVRSYCNNGDHGDWSSNLSFNSQAGIGGNNGGNNGGGGVCAVPSGLNITYVNGVATATWTPVAGAVGYYFEVENGIGNNNSFSLNDSVAGPSATIPGLLPNLLYKIKVRTKCSAGHSDWTDWMFFNSIQGGGTSGSGGSGSSSSCATPGGLAISAITNSSATLTWNAVTGAVGYYIEVEQVQGPTILEQFVGTNSFQVTGLSAGKTYKFKVRTKCGVKKSDWSGWLLFSTPNSMTLSTSGFVGNASSAPISLSFSPNPVSQGSSINLTYSGPENQQVTFLLRSMTGQLVYVEQAGSSGEDVHHTMEIGDLSKGIYLLQAVSGNMMVTTKVVVTE